MIKSLILLMTVRIAVSTVDINLPEMKYIADHLKPEECRKLVASLHYKSQNPPNNVDFDGKMPDKELPCLGLLVHWNSGEGEGKGETHEILFLRLKQIGREDLANWLAETVFQQLGIDLHTKIKKPFQEFLNDMDNGKDNDKFTDSADDFAPEKPVLSKKFKPAAAKSNFLKEEKTDWVAFDTVCWVVIIILAIATVILVGRAFYRSYTDGKHRPPPKSTKPRHRSYGKYEKMENRPINARSDSESEDRFDVRRKDNEDDPALKLMNLRN